VQTLDDLAPGMVLEGVVTNVAAFGAFVDIGVHQDGLCSEMSCSFVSHPRDMARSGDIVRVKALSVAAAPGWSVPATTVARGSGHQAAAASRLATSSRTIGMTCWQMSMASVSRS
jgi:transcriptional accessory protein Tex/SPT6